MPRDARKSAATTPTTITAMCWAAAVNLDIVAAAAPITESVVRLHSEEYPGTDEIILSDLAPQKEEEGTSAALLRGVCARCRELGIPRGRIPSVYRHPGVEGPPDFPVLLLLRLPWLPSLATYLMTAVSTR